MEGELEEQRSLRSQLEPGRILESLISYRDTFESDHSGSFGPRSVELL